MPDNDTTPSDGVDATAVSDTDTETDGEQRPGLVERYRRVRANAVGEDVGRVLAAPFVWVLAQFGALLYGFTRAFSRVLGGANLWRNVIKAGYKGLLKSTKGADAIMHIMHKGQLIHEPVAWDKDEQHYRTHDKEEWWNAPDESSHLYTAYNAVPTMWASSSANHVGDHVQAEVAEGMEFNDDRPVYRDAQVEMVLDATSPTDDAPGGAAVADGGQQSMGVANVSVKNPGVLDDFVVPLGEPGAGERGGRVVSGTKFYETYPETTATEEMQRQEWRGREAERDMDAMMDQMKKIVLYAIVGIVATVALFTIGPKLVGSGGGGGGGGSIIPLVHAIPGVF